MAKYRIEIVSGRNLLLRQRWHWRIVSTFNGKIVAHSENYSSLAMCSATAHAVALSAGWEIR